MIRPLTKDEFINIATNGIKINLYDGYVEDYIENLIRFIEEASHDYYISDYDANWCQIAKSGSNAVKVMFENDKINFYLPQDMFKEKSEKSPCYAAGIAIKIVYMHTVAWEAINNEGKISQPIDAWPI